MACQCCHRLGKIEVIISHEPRVWPREARRTCLSSRDAATGVFCLKVRQPPAEKSHVTCSFVGFCSCWFGEDDLPGGRSTQPFAHSGDGPCAPSPCASGGTALCAGQHMLVRGKPSERHGGPDIGNRNRSPHTTRPSRRTAPERLSGGGRNRSASGMYPRGAEKNNPPPCTRSGPRPRAGHAIWPTIAGQCFSEPPSPLSVRMSCGICGHDQHALGRMQCMRCENNQASKTAPRLCRLAPPRGETLTETIIIQPGWVASVYHWASQAVHCLVSTNHVCHSLIAPMTVPLRTNPESASICCCMGCLLVRFSMNARMLSTPRTI